MTSHHIWPAQLFFEVFWKSAALVSLSMLLDSKSVARYFHSLPRKISTIFFFFILSYTYKNLEKAIFLRYSAGWESHPVSLAIHFSLIFISVYGAWRKKIVRIRNKSLKVQYRKDTKEVIPLKPS
jgi:hypothetical protein